MPVVTQVDPVARLRELTPALRAAAADADDRRALAPEVTTLLKSAEVFQLLAPQSIGGHEVDPLTFLDVVEQAAYADGSVGWCTMIGGCYATFGGMMPIDGARELFGDPDTICAGAFRPNGAAVEVDDGYRVTGRWQLGSGSHHATWFIGGAVIMRHGQPVMAPSGMPLMREFFFPARETQVIDTWDSTGLRGTASHDYAVTDVFVPHARTVWFQEPPTNDGALYRIAPIAMFATFIGAVPLGIARHALDEFIELSQSKVPVLSQTVLADKPIANDKLGRAKALVDSSRVYLRDALARVWGKVVDGDPCTLEDRGELWLAATHAAHRAVEAIELLYVAAGADSVYRRTALDRCLRDARTSAQHICSQELNFEIMGRMLTGRDALASVWSMDYRGEPRSHVTFVP
jgi:alkylation response protein AidB-like acyl-CoA dehydrogenase